MRELWMDKYEVWDQKVQNHNGCAFWTPTLRDVERLLPEKIERSVETGCGKSTILFSNISSDHRVFAYDDRGCGDSSSVGFFESCPLSVRDKVSFVFGPTQHTLPVYKDHKPYDVVLLDGPHGYPFTELEYYFFYPHLKTGGILIVDDVHIPTIGRFADFLFEDEMFEFMSLVDTTALFRRTDAKTFDPRGDNWYLQRYNQRRVPSTNKFHLNDGPVREYFSEKMRALGR